MDEKDLYYIDRPDGRHCHLSEGLARVANTHFQGSGEVFTALVDNTHILPNIRQRQEAIRDILFRGGDVVMKEYDPLRNLNRKVHRDEAVKVWREQTRNEPWRKPLVYNHQFLFECIQEFQSICSRILEGTKNVESDPFTKIRAYFGQFVGNSDLAKEWTEEKEILDQSNLPFFSVMDYDSWTHQIEGIYPIGCISESDRQKLQKILQKGIQEGCKSVVVKIGNTECHIKLITPSWPVLGPVHKKEPANRRYIDFDIFTNIRHRIVDNSVDLLSRLKFYIEAAGLYSRLENAGLPVCFPEIREEEIIDIQNFYPLYHNYPKEQYTMNSLRLDRENPIAAITGLNAAGKSTILETVKCIVKMARAGLPVPASTCTIGNFGTVIHQEIIGSNMGSGLSTFKNQTRQLTSTLRKHQETQGLSIGLFDESLSGTDHITGKVAICEVLRILAQVIKKPTILVTHCTPAVYAVKENPADYPGVQLLCFKKKPNGKVNHKMQPGIGQSEGEYILQEEGLSLESFQRRRK